MITVVHPQMHDGCLAFLAYPSIIAQYANPRTAVIIDLSRVGGHCHAAVIRSDITSHELLQQVRLQIRADYDEEDLQVWVGDATLPATRTGLLNVAHGTLLTVMRTPYAPGSLPLASSLFAPAARWCRVDHMPAPPRTYSLALCRGQALDPVCPAFFPWAQTTDIVRKVYRLPQDDDKIVVVDNDPILDVQGEPCAQTAVAFSGSGLLFDQGPVQAYFLDVRLLGEAPRLVYLSVMSDKRIDLPDILDAAQIDIPTHLAGVVLQNTMYGDLQVLQVGLGPDLAHSIFHTCPSDNPESGEVEASIPGFTRCQYDVRQSSGLPAHAHEEPQGQVPTRFGQVNDPPTAHEALNLVAEEEAEQWDLLPIHTCFLVFVPRFRPEYVRVTLTLPCELDDALHTVSIARNSATSVHFDNLIPVEPQPDRTFASLLAVPDWVTDEICCLIDLRALDGRLFALVVFGSMKRSWILLHLGLPQDPHLRVYVAEELLEPDRLYPVHLGVTITILPADRTLQPGGTLADMLSSEAHWLPQCPLYDGPDDSSFLLLSDGGCKVVHIDVENALTSRRLKNISAETFQYCVDAVTVCKATPGPSDLAIQGQYCRAALTATETISRIPIPPGRLLPPQFILYIDQRLILSDISWRLVPHGYIGLDKLTAEFAGRAPPGYVVQFKGCPTEQHGDRTFLRIEHGQVITATYVEDNTASITTPPDDGSESSSQSDPDSDSEANSDMHSDSILRSPSNTDNRQQDRSRSPRGPPPPTPVRHLSLSTYCNSESVTFLVGSLGITKCAGFGVISDSVSIGLVWAGLQEPEILGDIYRQPAQKRFLDEPGGHTPRDAQHMQQLRHITLQLGGTWLPNTRPLIPGELAPIDFEFEHHVGRVPEVVIWVSFAILKEGYQAEQVTVQLSVPATPEEAEAALQAARDPRMRRLFPQVVAVLPQPSYGTAVYLANPIWYPNMPGVCFDLIDLDGRIYTTTLPDYISRHELLALVNHPQPDTLRVLVGFDAQQLTNEEPVHLYPGELITLLAPGGEEPIPYTIGQLLLMRDAWSASYSLPTPNTEHAYCLVARGRARLHIADASAPARYRDDIAAAVGMNTRDMRLYAASPATQDVAEQGVPCRTVIAAYDTQRQYAHPWHGILLDCRPILEDWQELCVTDGRLNVRSVLRALQDSTPRGWCPDLSVTADDDGYAHVRAGQVVIVTYHPAPQSATSGDASHASHASMPSVDPSGQQELSSPGSEPPASPASSEHNDIEESPAQDAGTDNRLMSLSVFVYSQQYTPEHCRLHLPPQPAIQDVIDSIRSIRHVIAQRIFPDLIPVHPQPDSGWVTMIALPAWPFIGTPVFIQVLGPAARRFAIYVPNVLTRADVLFLAQCDERAPCHVHFRDTPWPLPEDGAFPIRAGDLITIRPINVDLPVMRPLAVILAQASQWDWPYHTPAYWNAGAWLVTDQRSFHASIAPPPNAEVHSEAADAMCIPQDDVNVGPAYPSIVDHADAGHTSTSVVAVARRHLDTHDVPPTAVPYILDLRPLLLPLILERATDGVLEIAWVCERVQHLCPAGFCVRIYGGTFDGSAANNYRQVVPGAVIRVELHPTPPIPADSEESDGRFHSYYHTPDLSGQEADDASTVQHSSSSPTRQMPDTGGTGRPSEYGPSHRRPFGPIQNKTSNANTLCPIRPLKNSMLRQHGGQYIYVLSGLLAQYTRVITMLLSIAFACLLIAQVGRLTPSRMQTPVVVAIAVATGHCRVGRLQALWIVVMSLYLVQPTAAVPSSSAADQQPGTQIGPALPVLAPKYINLPARVLPTPCRGRSTRTREGDKNSEQHSETIVQDCELKTLLEMCSAETSHHFFLAATLLDTLAEHFGSCQSEPVTLTLAEQLPLTPFQTQVLSLRQVLPVRQGQASSSGTDWLDNDLRRLLTDHKVPLEQRTIFVYIRTWHAAGSPEPRLLRVFTDGSATMDANCQTPCAWAFGVWVPHAGESLLLGYAAGTAVPPGTPFHLGEADDLPQTSEQLAIAWALIWAVEHAAHYQCPLEFMYDCLTAGKGAFGDWRMPAQPNAGGHSVLSHHLLCLRQLAQVTLNISHGHVPGHTGCLENEYADQLAKQARRVPEDPYDRMLPRWPARFLQHSLRAWGWAAAVHHPDIPALFAFESEADRLQQLDRRPTKAPFPASSPAAPQTAPIADCVFHIVAVTYNTLTMRDTSASKSDPHVGMRVTGRKTILKDQLAPHQPLFIGLQETRLPEDGIQPGPDYLIYQSAATAAGHFGCSLWIARTVPYAVRDGKPLYLRSEHVNILGYSPRHITACVKAEALRLFVMVCHSPNAYSSPIMEYASFWQDRAQELARRAVGFDYLILADANARVGHLPTEHVGNHHEEVENPPGEIFHEFLASQQAFLPSTFQEVHHGPSHTWVSPGGDQHRIDYIVIPLAWKAFQMSSQVLYTVELLQAREDHYPVLFTCEFARHAPPDHYQPAQKRHDARPARPSTSADQAAVIRALHQVSCISWDTEVDAHYDQLAQSWREVGGQLTSAAPTSQSPAHPSLSEHTRRLVDYRRALRQYLRQEAAERRRRHLIYGFVALWLHARNRSFDLAQRHTLDRWFRELDISEAEALSRLHLFGFYLRKQVALDRRRYLQDLADNVKLQDLRNPRALYQAVRKAFPSARSARQSSFRPLPAVTDAQGKLVTTSEDRAERWRSFFGDQEAGFPATDQDYVVHMREGPRLQSTHVFDIGAVPTLPELENVTQALHTRKAAGLDCISGELLQVHVPTTMRQLFPVCLKACLALREPSQFRGGELICLAKKAGAALHCTGFRSILISSVPGKVLHRTMRSRLLDVLAHFRPPLQAGAMPGEGIEYISLAAQCFQQYREGKRQPWALVFYDIQAAFYSVVRELIVPAVQSDEGLLRLFHALKIPPQALTELANKLETIALLPSLRTSPHLVGMVQDLYRGTWFKLSQSALLTITQRGTRPGDPAADAVFGLAMAALLHSIDERLTGAGLLPDVPQVNRTPEWATLTSEPRWGCPAWADDFVQPVDGDSDAQLLGKVQQGVGLVSGCVSVMGMKLTFDAEKTAVLLPARLDLQQPPIQRHGESYYIPVSDPITTELHQLPVIRAYKHLGGILTADASPVMDLHHRHARAMSVVKPLRAKLFAQCEQPLALRRTLLRSLAVSKYVHTGAAILLKAAFHQRLWAQHYIQLWKALIARKAPDQHIHAYQVLFLARAPSPTLALAKARAVLLAKLVQAGPSFLGYLLVMHWQCVPRTAWLSQLEQDYKVVVAFLPQLADLVPPSAPVTAILDSLVEEPTWWLKQVRRACKVFGEDLSRWRADGSASIVATAQPVPAEDLPYTCHVCTASFRLRKHLGVHLARAHGIISPARHYAPVEYCLSCHRYYGQVPRVQMHLKQKHRCLLRCVYLIPPMDLEEIRAAERPSLEAKRKTRKGLWKEYAPPSHVSVIQGPHLPTRQERYPEDEDTVLSDLKPVYVPSPSVIAWITEYVEGASTEGPRTTAASFWCQRPRFTTA